jgi:hypothetical protein
VLRKNYKNSLNIFDVPPEIQTGQRPSETLPLKPKCPDIFCEQCLTVRYRLGSARRARSHSMWPGEVPLVALFLPQSLRGSSGTSCTKLPPTCSRPLYRHGTQRFLRQLKPLSSSHPALFALFHIPLSVCALAAVHATPVILLKKKLCGL